MIGLDIGGTGKFQRVFFIGYCYNTQIYREGSFDPKSSDDTGFCDEKGKREQETGNRKQEKRKRKSGYVILRGPVTPVHDSRGELAKLG